MPHFKKLTTLTRVPVRARLVIGSKAMTVEGPRHALVPAQAADQPEGDHWRAAPYRCPCGFAIDDADEFDQHIDASEGADPEHFEVLAGWTLQQVRRWQAAAMPNRPGTAIAGPVLTAGRACLTGRAGRSWCG